MSKPYTEANRPYRPFGAAEKLFYCKDSECLCEGPAGTGKTRAILEKCYLVAMKYSGCRILLVRKTRESMSESVLVTFEQKVIEEGSYLLEGGAHRRFRQTYQLCNGSTIVIGGMDKPEKVMSSEYDIIAAFEATELTEDDWERLISRLRNGKVPYQQAVADCNPGAPSHWLNRRASSGTMTRLLSRHEDNPLLFSAGQWTDIGTAYLEKLDRLTGPRHTRLRKGLWCSAEGMVYEDYDPAIHLIDRFDVPDSWRRIRVIDFGFTNPFVCQWLAIDPDGRIYRYRELYGTRKLVEDWAIDIKRLSEGEKFEATIADHDAEDRATLERHGVSTIPAHKAVATGIEAVRARLRKAGDGKPRLFLVRDSRANDDPALIDSKRPTCCEEEIEGYRYPSTKEGRTAKEEPVKEDDHAMDALRYGVAYADNLGRTQVDVRVITPSRKHQEVGDDRCWQ